MRTYPYTKLSSPGQGFLQGEENGYFFQQGFLGRVVADPPQNFFLQDREEAVLQQGFLRGREVASNNVFILSGR
jgi:hypothetical protein